MATYNTAFGSLPGYNEMMGTTNTTGGGQQQTYDPNRQYRQRQQPQNTFAQMQRQGMARPAPQAPQAQPFQQYGGSEQGAQMRQRLQQQLQEFGNAPSRYDTQAFQQIRGAQSANLNAEYQAQQKALNEDLARRGLSASSIGGGRMGDLAGQQSRALADLDARLLQQAADTQAQDRGLLLQAGQNLADLAGSQDLQQFEANRVAQAATFENQLRAAQFGQGQYEFGRNQALQAAQYGQNANQFNQELGLRLGELTGTIGGQQTMAARQFGENQRQFDIQQALQQQLGLGNLSIAQQRLAAENQQFGQSLEEQRAARLQQYGISQQDIGLRAQQLQQEAALQGRSLSLQEANSAAQNALERDRLTQQAAQFGLTLDEQKASRLQQFAISGQELGLRAQQLQQEAALQGRQMDITEAQNLALNGLERSKINQQASQFGLRLSEDREARLQQFGIAKSQLELETQRVAQQAAQFGESMTLDRARLDAQNNLEQQRINEAVAARQAQVGESQLDRELKRLMLGQQENEFVRNLSIQQQNANTAQKSAEAQAELARNQFMMQLLSALTPDKMQLLINNTLNPGAPVVINNQTGTTGTSTGTKGTGTTTSGTDGGGNAGTGTDWETTLGPTTWGAPSNAATDIRSWGGKSWRYESGRGWLEWDKVNGTFVTPGSTPQPTPTPTPPPETPTATPTPAPAPIPTGGGGGGGGTGENGQFMPTSGTLEGDLSRLFGYDY